MAAYIVTNKILSKEPVERELHEIVSMCIEAGWHPDLWTHGYNLYDKVTGQIVAEIVEDDE